MRRHRIRLHMVLTFLKGGHFAKLTYREYLAEQESTFSVSCELNVEETQFIGVPSEDDIKEMKVSAITAETFKGEINSGNQDKRFEVDCVICRKKIKLHHDIIALGCSI